MSTMNTPTAFTRADYNRLPEGFPAQLIEGILVKEPSRTYGHQAVSSRLMSLLAPLVDPGWVVFGPSDVALDDHNVYQPDLLVLRAIPPLDSRDVGVPRLAIEVLSPETARRDRDVKRRHLRAAGVDEVWIVDPETRTVEMDDSSGHRVASGDESLSSTVVPGFTLTPTALFGSRRSDGP